MHGKCPSTSSRSTCWYDLHLNATVIFLRLIEFLHRRSSLHYLQRSHEKFAPDFLPSSIAPEMVQKSDLCDNRFRCSIHYYHRQSAAFRMPAKRDSMGSLLLRYRKVY